MSDLCTINTQEADKILAALSDVQIVNDILNEGLEAMSDVYYNSVLASLRSKMGAAADTVGINGKYKYTLSSGVRKHPDKANVMFGLHGLTDFRLQFFEGGTKKRMTKGHKIDGYTSERKNRLKRSGKGGYRGMITANHFFSEGISNAENSAQQALIEAVNKAIKNRGIETA